MVIAATIICAGISSRMGSPKALLRYRGKTFLENIVDAVRAVGLRPCVVVVGPDGDKLLKIHDLSGVSVVTTAHFDDGPIGSIRSAIDVVGAQPVDGMLVWPVDLPHVAISTVEALIDGFRDSGHAIVVPEFEGRRGHPVLFGRAVFDELLAAPASEGARAVVRADSSRVRAVPVPDPAILQDLNTPSDYRSLLEAEDQSK